MSNIQTLKSRLEAIVGEGEGVNATVKFLTDEGIIFLDGTQKPIVFTEEDADADCTFEISAKNALKLLDRDLNPMMALMMGKLKIHGQMDVAMQLAQQFK